MMQIIPCFTHFYCLHFIKKLVFFWLGKPFFLFFSFFPFYQKRPKLASLQNSCIQTWNLHLLLGDIASACLRFSVNAQTWQHYLWPRRCTEPPDLCPAWKVWTRDVGISGFLAALKGGWHSFWETKRGEVKSVYHHSITLRHTHIYTHMHTLLTLVSLIGLLLDCGWKQVPGEKHHLEILEMF